MNEFIYFMFIMGFFYGCFIIIYNRFDEKYELMQKRIDELEMEMVLMHDIKDLQQQLIKKKRK